MNPTEPMLAPFIRALPDVIHVSVFDA